ncbi:hypothetical protein C9446_12675 [Providencia heimbachae]|uniref:host cell division inhibitor Icd-like protein n=1 Tax=Providencia heimbachae TaxID=333962 RepID=UPI0010C39CB4|nr:hypothetical protein C9446_12675 [Providencia heimbachae]
MMNIAANAYQVNDSPLAGNNVSSTYTPTNTVALNYGITGSQSDKLSSGYLANVSAQNSAKLFAQQPAKTLADVSAKIYANQSPKFTGNQSGEYFSGYKAGEYLSTPKRGSAKRGEITPFAKGDFSHLTQGLFGITTRDRIEFLESIKKGSQSATLGDVDIKYRASENINTSLLLWYGKYQFLGSIPRDCSSFLIMRLIQADTDASPSCSNAVFIPNSSDGSTRKAICLFPLPDILMVDTWFTPDYIIIESQVYDKCTPKTMPRSASTLTGHLTTNDNTSIEVAMSKHNTPVTGRTSLTPNQSYRWLFLALNRSDYTAKPCRIAVTAPNENSARLMLVRDYILSFAGRLPAQEVTA